MDAKTKREEHNFTWYAHNEGKRKGITHVGSRSFYHSTKHVKITHKVAKSSPYTPSCNNVKKRTNSRSQAHQKRCYWFTKLEGKLTHKRTRGPTTKQRPIT